MDTNVIEEIKTFTHMSKMRKPSHTKYTMKSPEFKIDANSLSVTSDLIKHFKDRAVEFKDMYSEDYVKQITSTMVSNAIKRSYGSEEWPDMGAPNELLIEKTKADISTVFHRRYVTAGSIISNEKRSEKWLVLVGIAQDTYTHNPYPIYAKIETKYFDLDKFPLEQIPNHKLASETAKEMTKKQFEDTIKTQRVSRTMSKL